MVENTTQIRDLTGVFVLKDMATFQEHSVVSREIIRKACGNNDCLCVSTRMRV